MFWKRIGYIVVSVLLVFSLLSVVTYGGVESETCDNYGKALLDRANVTGYEVDSTGDAVRYTPNGESTYLDIPLTLDSSCDFFVIELAEPIEKDTQSFFYLSFDGTVFEEEWGRGELSTDCDRITFFLDGVESCKAVRVEVRDAFAVKSISTHRYTDQAPALELRPLAIAVFGLALVVLCLTERKFGYFAWVRSHCVDKLEAVRALWRDGKIFSTVLYAAAHIVTVLLFFAVGVLILFGVYTPACFVLVFVWTAVALVLQLTARLCTGRDAEPAKLFFTVALLLGVLFCYTMPTCLWVSWDDAVHFRRSYDWAHLLYRERPYSAHEMMTRWNLLEHYDQNPTAFVYDMVKSGAYNSYYFPSTQHFYTSISYLPMIATIFLLSSIGADIVKILVLCRFANLLVYATIVFFGIRKLKSGAYIFSAVCLFPTAFFLACSTNYDFWLTAWFAYAFAYLISELQQPEKKLELWDMVKILAALFIACSPKALYGVMLLPLLFLKKTKFKTETQAKRFRLCTLAVMALILFTLVLPMFFSTDAYTDVRGGEDVSAGGQIAFILTNPFRYAGILLRFLGDYISFGMMGHTLSSYAYLGFSHPFFGTVAIFVLLFCIFTDRREDDAYESMQGIRFATLGTVLIQVVLIITSLYVGFTPVGADTVLGCQQRYLLPIMLPFCFFLAPKGLRASVDSRVMGAVVFGGLAANILMSYFTTYLWMFLR